MTELPLSSPVLLAPPLDPTLAGPRRTARRGVLACQQGISDFQRDRDVILASPEFARLRDVTQVMAPGGPGVFQTRYSHSLQVARIGRAVAEKLLRDPQSRLATAQGGGLDPTVVAAAALAHDLGHPPFGHDAEDELDRLLLAAGVPDGFEANAQSFRMVCALAGEGESRGFNLTRATLAGILKYPWLRGGNSLVPGKWGAYASEAEAFRWVVADLPTPGAPGLEARIMDWADLLAYAVYDFEDFVRSGDIPLALLRTSAAERQRLLDLVFARRRVPGEAQVHYERMLDRLLVECPVPGDNARHVRNALRCFANHLVDDAIDGVRLQGVDSTAVLKTDPEQHAMIMLTEGLTWHYVIGGAMLAPLRAEQRQLVRELFMALAEAAGHSSQWGQLPSALRRGLVRAKGQDDVLRLVADAVASMPERDAIVCHARFSAR